MYYSDFSYLFDLLGWSVALGGLLQLALYVAESLGLYAMARNTGVHNPWFAWLPIARDYLIGELSDRYNLSSRQKKWSACCCSSSWSACLSIRCRCC